MRIAIGAPVTQRAWILNEFFEHLDAQGMNKDLNFFFMYGRPADELEDGTLDILRREAASRRWGTFHIIHDTGGGHLGSRKWNLDRYHLMARLRNELLREVRGWRPEYYLSLDTDMLLPPGAIQTLVDSLDGSPHAGVSPVTFMTPSGTRHPNAFLPGWTARPVVEELDGTTEVAAAFGVKLMSKKLYRNVDYAAHSKGEDVGWAENVQKQKMTLGLVPQVRVKHVMTREMKNHPDPRVGF